MTEHDRPSAAIVGAGLMGRWHAHAVSRSGVGRVVAVVDADLARAGALAARHRGARATTSLADVGAVDVVHVCTPLASHAPLVRQALASGAHAIVEKPVAADAAETAALLALAAEHARLLVPVHQCLFQRGVREVIRALPSLGTLLHVDTVACTAGATGLGPEGHDRVALEILPHALSLVARLVSPTLADAAWQTRRSAPGELRVDGVLAGVSVSLLVSTAGRPTTHALRLVGTRATAHVDLFHGFATIARGGATRADKIVRPFADSGRTLAAAATNLARRVVRREPAYPGLRELIQDSYVAAAGGRPAPITSEETLAVARVLDAVRERLPMPATFDGPRGEPLGTLAGGVAP